MLQEETYSEVIQIDALRRQKSRLEERLEDGYVRIEEAILQGKDVSAWESFWISLLHEYESVCNDLQDAA